MPIVNVTSLADDRLWPYRDLKDRDLRQKDGRFIAEGRHVVDRLLARPGFVCESILCLPGIADEIAARVPEATPMFVLEKSEVEAVIGFKFHQGCLAVGRAPALPTVSAWLGTLPDGPKTFVVAHQLNNTENLGTIIRVAAGFGAAGLILGPQTADPFFRQSIRVSMGTVFSLPMAQSDDLLGDLGMLRSRGFQVLATVLRPDATPLDQVRPADLQAIVLGSEAHGLDDAVIAACTQSVTIPMHYGTDSLNVSIAAAVFLYALTRPV
jgi:tRNA G18 (ribose-2'-O)-methylase SpoU